MNTKLLRTCLLIGSILSAIVLWITRTGYSPSLSSFANANNQIFYYLCLLSSSWFFILNGSKRDNNLDYWVGFGMGCILLTNMYIMPIAHNIATGLTLGLAIFNIIYETSKKERIVNIFLGIGAIGIFCIGYFTSFNFLFAEVIAMACIAIGMIRGIWITDK